MAEQKIGPFELNSIITGDARQLAEAIPDNSVDLIFTDPPFGIDFKYNNGYKDDPAQYLDLFHWLVTTSNRVTKPGGLIFIAQAMGRLRETWGYCPEQSRLFALCKNFVQMNRGDIPHAFDPVIFWQKPGGKLWERNGRDWFLANTANTNGRGLAEAGWHSCPRPLDAVTYIVNTFCPIDGAVVDFFIGSGTTGVAARLTGRNFWGCEIDPATADKARERVLLAQPPLLLPEPVQLELA